MSEFEQWVKSTSHYPKLMLIHGERLFIKDGDQYKILAIQWAYEAWQKWVVQDVKQDVNGLDNIPNEQSSSCNGCCNSLVPELISVCRELIQTVNTQNEVMAQIMNQNNELIAQCLDEDDDQEQQYLSE